MARIRRLSEERAPEQLGDQKETWDQTEGYKFMGFIGGGVHLRQIEILWK